MCLMVISSSWELFVSLKLTPTQQSVALSRLKENKGVSRNTDTAEGFSLVITTLTGERNFYFF